MSKKDFIALADAIRKHNGWRVANGWAAFDGTHLDTLADFCRTQNPNFKRDRWLDYIAGKCGPNGGKIK